MSNSERPRFNNPELTSEILTGLKQTDVVTTAIPLWEALQAMSPVINGVRVELGLNRCPFDSAEYIIHTFVPSPGRLIPQIARAVYDSVIDPAINPELRQEALTLFEQDAEGMLSWHTKIPRPMSFVNVDSVGSQGELHLSEAEIEDLVMTHVGDSLRSVKLHRMEFEEAVALLEPLKAIISGPIDPNTLIYIDTDCFTRYIGRIQPGEIVTLLRRVPVFNPARDEYLTENTYLFDAMATNIFKIFMAAEMKAEKEHLSWEEALGRISSEINLTSELEDVIPDRRVNRAVLRYMRRAGGRKGWINVLKAVFTQAEYFFINEKDLVCGAEASIQEEKDWEIHRQVLLEEIKRQRKMRGSSKWLDTGEITIHMN